MSKVFSNRLFNMECSGLQARFPGVMSEFQFVSNNNRKQYLFGRIPFLNKRMGLHFIAERIIEQYGSCSDKVRMFFQLFKQGV